MKNLSLDELKGLSLASLVRKHQEDVSIGLALQNELAPFLGDLSAASDRKVKGMIGSVYFVALRIKSQNDTVVRAIGYRGRDCYLTSPIERVDLERRLFLTASQSLYGVKSFGDGELPVDLVAFYGYALNVQHREFAEYIDAPLFFV